MIFLGIGSNLSSSYGDRFYNIDLSISYLESYGILLVKKSSYYETPSYPYVKNPKFIYNVTIPTKFMYFMVRILSKKNLHKLLLRNSEPNQMPRET